MLLPGGMAEREPQPEPEPATSPVYPPPAGNTRKKGKRRSLCVICLRRCPAPCRTPLIHMLFYPTLGFAWLRRVCCCAKDRWYDTIRDPVGAATAVAGSVDDGSTDSSGKLIQGAFPLPFILRRLVQQEQLSVIISNTAEHKGWVQLMKQLGVTQHRFPTMDFEVPSVAHLHGGADAIHAALVDGENSVPCSPSLPACLPVSSSPLLSLVAR